MIDLLPQMAHVDWDWLEHPALLIRGQYGYITMTRVPWGQPLDPIYAYSQAQVVHQTRQLVDVREDEDIEGIQASHVAPVMGRTYARDATGRLHDLGAQLPCGLWVHQMLS